MKKLSDGQILALAWGTSLVPALLAIIVWGQGFDWDFSNLTVYGFFPLLGLLAFSLMWSHYVASALRQYFGAGREVLAKYFEITSTVVLLAILLHPGLLAWQLWKDGLGLPLGSYRLYVGDAMFISVLAGLTAWVLFLSYELRRVYGSRPWWKFVQYASDGAMVLIFFHALSLGRHVKTGWFRNVWIFYGVTFLVALSYGYYLKYQARAGQK